MHQHKHFLFYPEMTSFSFPWQFFRVNWIPASFSLVSTAVRAERAALYIRRCFFLLSRSHACAIQDKLATLYLQAS